MGLNPQAQHGQRHMSMAGFQPVCLLHQVLKQVDQKEQQKFSHKSKIIIAVICWWLSLVDSK
uniref:Uncharacterized protein n=1 Tax=Anguilla anguilla TaxID=7936 RepID=A0A0E9RTN0_ANGAN